MMFQNQRKRYRHAALATLCAMVLGLASTSRGDVIMTLSLSAQETDQAQETSNMSFANGVFAMSGDGKAGTPGDRNVSITYPLNGTLAMSTDEPTPSASASLFGMMAAGSPAGNGSIVQVFDFGNLAVYDEDNSLVLSAELTKSTIQGKLGPTSGQGLYLGFGTITGGSIASQYQAASLRLRIDFPEIPGGFSVTGSMLDPFDTWTPLIEIMATPIVPEPSLAVPLSAVLWTLAPLRRRRR